ALPGSNPKAARGDPGSSARAARARVDGPKRECKMKLDPANKTALRHQLRYRAAGNPPSTVADSAISNCFPGLEFDFRNVFRRVLEGIELHEADNFVVWTSDEHKDLLGRRLL